MECLYNKYFKLIFTTTVCVLISSCSKITEYPVIHIPQELKEYTVFKPGSYWVYEDSVSRKQDSISVTSITIDSSLGTSGYNVSGSYYAVNVDIQYLDVNGPVQNSIYFSPTNSYDCSYNTYPTSVQGTSYGPINVWGASINSAMFYPFNPGYQIDWYFGNDVAFYDTIKFVRKISNYNVNGLAFPEVVEFSDSKEVTGYNTYGNDIVQPAYHYYARGVGLIQYQLVDSNKNYKLIRYHLN